MALSEKLDWKSLGAKRLQICDEAKSQEDWKRLWYAPQHSFPFQYGDCWNFCTEYQVVDFESEVGFFIEGLCLESYVLSHDYAMFTDKSKTFYMSFIRSETGSSTSGETFRLAFMVKDIAQVVEEVASRGIEPVKELSPVEPESPMMKVTFLTPNGIPIDLWGFAS